MNEEQIIAKIREFQEELNKMETVISNNLRAGTHPTDAGLIPYQKTYELLEKQILELQDKLEILSNLNNQP